jgi:hypothetical protein
MRAKLVVSRLHLPKIRNIKALASLQKKGVDLFRVLIGYEHGPQTFARTVFSDKMCVPLSRSAHFPDTQTLQQFPSTRVCLARSCRRLEFDVALCKIPLTLASPQ